VDFGEELDKNTTRVIRGHRLRFRKRVGEIQKKLSYLLVSRGDYGAPERFHLDTAYPFAKGEKLLHRLHRKDPHGEIDKGIDGQTVEPIRRDLNGKTPVKRRGLVAQCVQVPAPEQVESNRAPPNGDADDILPAKAQDRPIDSHLGQVVVGTHDTFQPCSVRLNPSCHHALGEFGIKTGKLLLQALHLRGNPGELGNYAVGTGKKHRCPRRMLDNRVGAGVIHLLGKSVGQLSRLTPVIGPRPGDKVFETIRLRHEIAGNYGDPGTVERSVPLGTLLYVAWHQYHEIGSRPDRPAHLSGLKMGIPVRGANGNLHTYRLRLAAKNLDVR